MRTITVVFITPRGHVINTKTREYPILPIKAHLEDELLVFIRANGLDENECNITYTGEVFVNKNGKLSEVVIVSTETFDDVMIDDDLLITDRQFLRSIAKVDKKFSKVFDIIIEHAHKKMIVAKKR